MNSAIFYRIILSACLCCLFDLTYAAKPIFLITALEKPNSHIAPGQTTIARYTVTNNTSFVLTNNGLSYAPAGVTQTITSTSCQKIFTLAPQQSCELILEIVGNDMRKDIMDGPIICQTPSNTIYCSKPNSNDSLQVQLIDQAILKVLNSPLYLTAGGSSGALTVMNTSDTLTITNIAAVLTGTALDGQVTQNANNCLTLPPNQSCQLIFQSSNQAVPLTNFSIEGIGAMPTGAAIAITAFNAIPINISGSPLILDANGSSGTLTVTNLSSIFTAQNISADLTGTPLDGQVTQDASDCTSVLPLQQCTLVFTPLSTAVSNTSVPIRGTNTLTATANISVNAAQIVLSVAGSPLELQINGSSGVMTITNTSGILTALNIQTNLSGTALFGKVTETGNTCAVVGPGASCTITFTPGSSSVGLTGIVIQGTNTNAVSASITVDQRAYIGTFSFSTVAKCIVNGVTGAVGSCVTTGNGLSSAPFTIVHPTGNFSYTSRFAAGEIDKCTVDSSGLLSGCALEINTSGPQGQAIHPNGLILYITNFFVNNITICSINPTTGALSSCTAYALTGLSSPSFITVDPTATYAYISNRGNNTITQCTIAGDFTLTNCTNIADATFVGPTAINLNPTGSYAYIANGGNNTISLCEVSGMTGTLSNCTVTGSGFNGLGNVAINNNNTFAYPTSLSPSSVGRCTIGNGGVLTGCALSVGIGGSAIYLTLFN